MKAWITKYALTSGIEEYDGGVPDTFPDMFCYRSGGHDMYAHGKDWHKTKEAAINRANEMKAAKLASLQKQIVKINKMTFQ